MKKVHDLPLWPLWVNPEHRVKSALVLMRGHGVSGLGVKKGDTFLGVVGIEDLVGAEEDEPVERVMRRDVDSVRPDMPLRRVAEFMTLRGLQQVPVLDESGAFLGIVAARDLLGDIGRNFDPLTQLPWGDSLREWGVSRLQEGREVTIAFFDLDDFGQFNKEFGHVIGDRVLQEVANELRLATDPAVDHLCRYAGDEFVVGTLRLRDEAERLAGWLQQRISMLHVESADKPVSAAVGVYGGRRTRERENVHFAATLDSLINLASRQCTSSKRSASAAPRAAGGERREFEFVSVRISDTGMGAKAVVVIKAGGRLCTGVDMGAGDSLDVSARAAARALEQADLRGRKVAIEEVILSKTAANERLVTVVGSVEGRPVGGSCFVSESEERAAVEAVLDAAGRELLDSAG